MGAGAAGRRSGGGELKNPSNNKQLEEQKGYLISFGFLSLHLGPLFSVQSHVLRFLCDEAAEPTGLLYFYSFILTSQKDTKGPT